MTLLISKLRELSVFIYTLIFLLIFNLYFNLNYSWYGISLIVRIYLLVLSFYLVFIFASLDIDQLKKEYSAKFGAKGSFILFIETRISPFLFIYLSTILFTLIAYIRNSDWPWNPILSLLNGRYSNNIIYSWLLLIILKLKKKPSITIPLFIGISFIYGILDGVFYSSTDSGTVISVIKFLKILIFSFFLIGEFLNNIPKSAIFSFILSLLIFLSTIGSFAAIFRYSKETSFQSKEAGLIMLRMGFTYPLEKLRNLVLKASDRDLLEDLLSLSKQYNIEVNYSKEEWENLLFSGSVGTAELISGYIINKNTELSYEKIISYAEQKSADKSGKLEKAGNFIKLSAKYRIGHEKDFLDRLKKSNKIFKLWGMRVLAENKSIESIPLLLNFVTDIDEAIANSAYDALKIIADMDPAAALDKKKNDPDTIEIFKKYYLKYSHNRKAY